MNSTKNKFGEYFKELRIASTGKDPKSGRLTTQEYLVKGPVQILLTTALVDIDEELLNRFLLLR